MINHLPTPTSEQLIHDISRDLLQDAHAYLSQPSLPKGIGGPILYFSYLYHYTGEGHYLKKVNELTTALLDLADLHRLDASLENGWCGIGWLIQHLIHLKILDDDSVTYLEQIDALLLRSLTTDLKQHRYDFFTGLLGKGLYFLERHIQEDKTEQLKTVLYALLSLSEEDHLGQSWQDFYSFRRSSVGAKAFSLGLSHGLPSILVFLSQLEKRGIETALVGVTIQKSLQWLKAFERSFELGVCFPSKITNYTCQYPERGPDRLAWCHGDLGIAAAILQCGISISDPSIISWGQRIASSHINRWTSSDTQVSDAGLCHGTAGVALLYKKICDYTGNPQFQKSEKKWLQRTREYAVHLQKGTGGYMAWNGEGSWEKNLGFLEGAAGIGLMLASDYFQDTAPAWGRLLLLF